MPTKKINTKELEKHIANKRLEEQRKNKERVFLTSLVLACMVALYVVFSALNADNDKALQREVEKPSTHQPNAKKMENRNHK